MIISKKRPSLIKLENLTTAQTTLYVSMLGSANIFLLLLISFWAFASVRPIDEISNYFSIGTSVILISGYPIAQLTKAFDGESIHKILRIFSFALISGCFFTFFQLKAWEQMNLSLFDINGEINFLYGLSVLHLVHLAALMSVIAVVMYRYIRKMDGQVEKLILFSNRFEKSKLEMISLCWFYLQVIWAVIYTAYSFH